MLHYTQRKLYLLLCVGALKSRLCFSSIDFCSNASIFERFLLFSSLNSITFTTHGQCLDVFCEMKFHLVSFVVVECFYQIPRCFEDHNNLRRRSLPTGFPFSVVVSKENPKVSPIFTSLPQAAATSIHRTLSAVILPTDKPNILCRSIMSVTSPELPGHLCHRDNCLASRAASP